MNFSSLPVNRAANFYSGARHPRLGYGEPMTGEIDEETLGDRARQRREALKLTPTEVARRVNDAGRAGVKIQHIQKLEKNKQRNVTYLAELAIALECDPIWLGTGEFSTDADNVDEDRLVIAWEAVQTVIQEHDSLDLNNHQRIRLALAVYLDLGDRDWETMASSAK